MAYSVGFNYNDSYCDWDYTPRLDYKFVQWHGIPLPSNLQDASDFADEVTSNSEVFGLLGLFAGFSVSF